MNRLVEKSSNNAARIKIGESSSSGNHNGNNNIILLRGAQSDGGHIILQNGQELLQLLNGEAKSGATATATTASGKTIILQSPRIKQQSEAAKNVKNRIMVHQTTTLDHHQQHHQQSMNNNKNSVDVSNLSGLSSQGVGQSMDGETILLQTNGLSGKRISATTLSDGSILLHPRMMDSFTTSTATNTTGTSTSSQSTGNSSDGPILLQTLKRFDKSIFVLRNSSASTSVVNSEKTVIASYPSKMETSSSSSSSVAELETPVVVTNKKSGGTRANSAGGSAAKANVFNNKANNVIGNGGASAGGNGRSNGISTRSSTGQQKQQRGANKSDSNKKEAAGAKQSNIPLGSGEWQFSFNY